MKFCFLPYFEPVLDYASSRLRAYYPALSLRESGTEAVVGWCDDADVYVVIKSFTDESIYLDLLNLKVRRNISVIYDVCDRLWDKEDINYNPRFPLLAYLADKIIVPTQKLKVELDKFFTNVEVLADGLDYGITEPYPPVDNNDLVWFGNCHYFNDDLRSYFDQSDKVTVIADLERLTVPFNMVQWNFNTFIDDLRQSGICVLQSDHDYKSDNKLMVAIACGLPVVSLGGYANDRLLKRFGLDGVGVNDLLTLEAKKEYLREIQPFVMEMNYKNSAKYYLELCNQ